MFCLSMMFSYQVIVDITISCRSFVFSQPRAKVSVGFTDVSGLAVAAFDLVSCSLSVLRGLFLSLKLESVVSGRRKGLVKKYRGMVGVGRSIWKCG